MKIQISPALPAQCDICIIITPSPIKASALQPLVDSHAFPLLQAALQGKLYTGERNSSLPVVLPAKSASKKILLWGMGRCQKLTALDAMEAGNAIAAAIAGEKPKTVAIMTTEGVHTSLSSDIFWSECVKGLEYGLYRFTKYQTKKPTPNPISACHIITKRTKSLTERLAATQALVDGLRFARDVMHEPANHLYPEEMEKRCKALKLPGLTVESLNRAQMEKLGMGALLGVAQGSAREPRLIILQWKGGKAADKPIALVGKGVTFDTGGISIKPSSKMEEMKYDMGGAAAVVGSMIALATRKAKVNVVGIVAMVENMPDGNAQRPGDIVTTMSGQTVEVLNTDAEGRLILADALWYCQDRFAPRYMVNFATLTGAILVSLGNEYAGLFSNNDALSAQLLKAGEQVNEKLWRMPLHAAYDKLMDSPIADMQNITNTPYAGSITAAQFLQRFVNKTPWAHADIAGVAYDRGGASARGPTGFGIQLVNAWITRHEG